MPRLLKCRHSVEHHCAEHRTRRSLGTAVLTGAVGALVSAARAQAQDPASARILERRALPEFAFSDAAGRSRTLAEFSGSAFVLNFWATWCPPCVEEMPSLDRLHATLAPSAIQILPLSSDRGGRAQVEPFYRSHALRHVGIWLDRHSAAARAFGVRGLPTTVLTDRGGYEVARIEGALDWDRPDVAAEIRRLAGPAPSMPPAPLP